MYNLTLLGPMLGEFPFVVAGKGEDCGLGVPFFVSDQAISLKMIK